MEKEELIIKFDLNKFVEKFNSLDPRLLANIKNQLIDVIKIENSMIEEQNNLFYQYEKIVNLKEEQKDTMKIVEDTLKSLHHIKHYYLINKT